jgi:hypothetical protein
LNSSGQDGTPSAVNRDDDLPACTDVDWSTTEAACRARTGGQVRVKSKHKKRYFGTLFMMEDAFRYRAIRQANRR